MIRQTALAAAPLLIPLTTALITLALSGRARLQRAASLIGVLLMFAASTLLLLGAADGQASVLRFGGWAAPFAIEFRIDGLSALMLTVASLLAAIALAYSHGDARSAFPHPMLHGVLAGAAGAYSTADLFNLYVWLEVMLVAVLGLIVAGRRPQHLEAGLKYLVLNVFGTVLLLMAVAGLYGLTGQLNFEALGESLSEKGQDPLALALGALLIVSLLIKAGAFPFLFWLPASYPVLPVPLMALFTSLMTKIAAYAVLRVSTQIFPQGAETLSAGIGWIAVATMVVGVLGAVYHYDIRRILAFHSVSQMGYILLAVALGGTAAVAAAVFFILHHVFVKANLYLIAGMMARQGSFDLRRLGGLYGVRPALAILFGITAASLVGLPPLSGFWAKLLVLREGFAQAEYIWATAALVTGGLTLLSMAKIWTEAFWKPHAGSLPNEDELPPRTAWLASSALAVLALVLGLAPGLWLTFLERAVRVSEIAPVGVLS